MANGKWQQWVEPESLERIANWAANGLTHEEIARSMGVNPSTLYNWFREHLEISEAVKRGRLLSCECVENALFRKATGQYEVVETFEEFKGSMQDGKPTDGELTRRTVTKHGAPDTAAAIFYLKNRMPERYSDRRTMEVEASMPTVVLGVEPRRADG